jgi:hypothetical protein
MQLGRGQSGQNKQLSLLEDKRRPRRSHFCQILKFKWVLLGA